MQGLRGTGGHRKAFAQWFFPLQVSCEFDEAAPQLPEQLSPYRVLGAEDDEITYFPTRHDLRIEAIRRLGELLTGARVRLCASGNNSQCLAADRAAAGADEEPVGREGPPRPQVRGKDAGLGAEHSARRGGLEAELHRDLDPARLRPGAQSPRVQTGRRHLPSRRHAWLRPAEITTRGRSENRTGIGVTSRKVRPAKGWCLRPASPAGRSLAPSRAYRTAPILPLRPGLPEKATHDCVRHGTTTLFAALEVATGKVTDACHPRHRHEEFLRFLKKIARAYPRQRLHIVADNYTT
jgi:hypothetical protein